MLRSSLVFSLLVATLCLSPGPARAQFEHGLEAHGGLEKWKSFCAVEFNLTSENSKGAKQDHQLFDLRSRDGLITSEKYTLGANKGEVWIKPALDALGGTPPRFYMWTPFYFFGMPFVFADPGASQESLGRKTFQGQEYDAFKITFKAGTGDSSDDFYIAYFDPASGQLKLASYVVTFPALRKGKAVKELEPHAIMFEEWQEVDGLRVPKAASYYAWKNENIEGPALGKLLFSNVHFSSAAPDDSRFQKPDDAIIAPMQ